MGRRELVFILLIVLGYFQCTPKSSNHFEYLVGNAMGTSYSIIVGNSDVSKEDIDDLLRKFDFVYSTYNKESFISRLNNSNDTSQWFSLKPEDSSWFELLPLAFEINNELNGAFDPSAAPLFDYWGFGNGDKQSINNIEIDSLLAICSMSNFEIIGDSIRKLDPLARLNLNAIAKGYGVDVVALYLKNKGVEDFMVEIGGEVRVSGLNPQQNNWTIGITKPSLKPDSKEMMVVAAFSNWSMATSGNYRNYFVDNGQIYGHTIDPRTGYSARNTILSATVFSEDCATADACATAFMVMGIEESIKWLNRNREVEAYLIYSENSDEEYKTFSTEGLYQIIKNK